VAALSVNRVVTAVFVGVVTSGIRVAFATDSQEAS
jgi:hypothetical protein